MDFISNKEMLASILEEHYDLGSLEQSTEPEKGHTRQVRIVLLGGQHYVLKVFQRNELNLKRMLLVQDLIEQGIKIPELIKTTSETPCVFLDSYCLTLSHYIKGGHPSINDQEVKKAAQLIAAFHRETEGYELDGGNATNNRGWIEQRVGQNIQEIQNLYGKEFEEDYKLMLKFATKPHHPTATRGIAHNDFKADNIMVDQSGKQYLIDIYNMATEELVADLAKFIKAELLSGKGNGDEDTQVKAFLEEYTKMRPHMEKDFIYLEAWVGYWCSVTFFFFMCQYDKATQFKVDIFEESQKAASDLRKFIK